MMICEKMAPSLKCPLCGRQKGRRACPALGHQICTTCCGTKRLTEIHCPADCVYLASAREHPPAATLRQRQRDVGLLVQVMRDLNQRQSETLFLVLTFLMRHEPPALQPLLDDDVADAAGALAATFETAARGVIYEHQPASRPAARLVVELKALLAEARRGAGSSFDRDVAVVLRRLEQGVRGVRAQDPGDRRAFLGVLGRVLAEAPADADAPSPEGPPRLIVP
jgi:hypothetical protein